jgi:hypothetical protein
MHRNGLERRVHIWTGSIDCWTSTSLSKTRRYICCINLAEFIASIGQWAQYHFFGLDQKSLRSSSKSLQDTSSMWLLSLNSSISACQTSRYHPWHQAQYHHSTLSTIPPVLGNVPLDVHTKLLEILMLLPDQDQRDSISVPHASFLDFLRNLSRSGNFIWAVLSAA